MYWSSDNREIICNLLVTFFKKRIANQNIFFTINHFAIYTVLPQSLRIVSAFLDCSRIDRNWLCLYWVRHVGRQCQFSWVVLFVTIVICILHHDHKNLATINNDLQNLKIHKILSQSNWIEEYNNPTILVQSSTIVKHIYLDCDCPNPIVIVTIQIQSTPSKYNWHNPNTIDIFQLQSTQLFLAQLFGTTFWHKGGGLWVIQILQLYNPSTIVQSKYNRTIKIQSYNPVTIVQSNYNLTI